TQLWRTRRPRDRYPAASPPETGTRGPACTCRCRCACQALLGFHWNVPHTHCGIELSQSLSLSLAAALSELPPDGLADSAGIRKAAKVNVVDWRPEGAMINLRSPCRRLRPRGAWSQRASARLHDFHSCLG